MDRIQVGCRLTYQVNSRTTFLFNVGVAETEFQTVSSDRYETLPYTPLEILNVGLCANRVHRLTCEPGMFSLSYEATVQMNSDMLLTPNLTEHEYRDLPAEVLPFLNPSRYCESDRLANFAFSEFGNSIHGYFRVRAICDWTKRHLSYVPDSTNNLSTACDVIIQRQGVCRDFTHLAIALCRGLGIPARYVAGYAMNLNPPDFHGFFEAYLAGRWFLFDATSLAPIGGLVRIASGNDAADVPFATILGSAALLEKTVFAQGIGNVAGLYQDPDSVGISTVSRED
jgi:transglutaminase-like putative cysteine protease